jgi:hypothetical protein
MLSSAPNPFTMRITAILVSRSCLSLARIAAFTSAIRSDSLVVQPNQNQKKEKKKMNEVISKFLPLIKAVSATTTTENLWQKMLVRQGLSIVMYIKLFPSSEFKLQFPTTVYITLTLTLTLFEICLCDRFQPMFDGAITNHSLVATRKF